MIICAFCLQNVSNKQINVQITGKYRISIYIVSVKLELQSTLHMGQQSCEGGGHKKKGFPTPGVFGLSWMSNL